MDQQSSKVAKSLGATSTYLVEGKSAEDMAKDVVALFSGGQQPDITIECSGAQSSIAMGIYATKSGTTFNLCHEVGWNFVAQRLPGFDARSFCFVSGLEQSIETMFKIQLGVKSYTTTSKNWIFLRDRGRE